MKIVPNRLVVTTRTLPPVDDWTRAIAFVNGVTIRVGFRSPPVQTKPRRTVQGPTPVPSVGGRPC